MRGQNLSRFWRDVVPDSDIVQLSDEDLVASQQEEEDAAVLNSYWSQFPPQARLNGVNRTSISLPADVDMDEASETSDADELQPPLDNNDDRPVLDESLMGREVADHDMVEDDDADSRCSQVLYENGTGLISASAESSDALLVASPPDTERMPGDDEPNFKNCLAKTTASLSVTAPDKNEVLQLNHSPIQSILHSKSNGELPHYSGELVSGQELTEDFDSTTKETTASDACIMAGQVVDELQSSLITGTVGTAAESTQQVEVSVERKIALPKNKLPIAVIKPDNPRAIRYWLDQRRTASSAVQHSTTETHEEEKENDPTDPEDWDLFHLGRDQGVHDVLGQRVLQVSLPISL